MKLKADEGDVVELEQLGIRLTICNHLEHAVQVDYRISGDRLTVHVRPVAKEG